jgi:predicted dehydrogenase
MLDKDKPDGVIVCVGPAFHGQAAVDIMERGFHVYTEKPPAEDLDQCRQMVEVHKMTGMICMTALKKRFAPAYAKAKELIDSGGYGVPALLNIMRTSGEYKHGDPDKYILDSSIHIVDLAVYLCGPITSVSGTAGPGASYCLSLAFASGATGSMAMTDRMSYKRGWEDVTVVTTEGLCIQVDNSVEMLAIKHDQPVAGHKPEFVAGSSHSSVEMGFQGELQAFVDAIAENNPEPEASISQIIYSMAAIDAMRKAVKTGKTIKVEGV